MDKDNLMTVQEFNSAINRWALKIQSKAQSTLGTNTHSKGALSGSLQRFVDRFSEKDPAYKVAYRFQLYGVFRHWGAGRGYKIKNFVVSVNKKSKVKRFSPIDMTIKRHPLNWIDKHIDDSKMELADIMLDFYRDRVLERLLNEIKKAKIHKV